MDVLPALRASHKDNLQSSTRDTEVSCAGDMSRDREKRGRIEE